MEIKNFNPGIEPPLKRQRLEQEPNPIIDRTVEITQPTLNREETLPPFNWIMQPIDPPIQSTNRLALNILTHPIESNPGMQQMNSGQQNEGQTREANQSLELAPFNPDPDVTDLS